MAKSAREIREAVVAGNMSTHDNVALDTSVLLVVDADPQARKSVVSALIRRSAPDFRVLSAGSAEAGLHGLERLAQQGDVVAFVAADL